MQKMPEQAVILAGGRGSRLMPLTKDCPKPMVPVNGVPFLQILLDQLEQAGFTRVVLLTGYLAEQVEQRFGCVYGQLELTYVELPEELDTAERVWAARDLFDAEFMLLYADNYLRLDFQQHLAQWQNETAMQLLVVEKSPGNLQLNESGQVVLYDARRQSPLAKYVELGFMWLRWRAIEGFFHPDVKNFNTIIQKVIGAGLASATYTERPYFSISDPERLAKTAAYFQPRKLILIDRDGTINKRAPQGEYVTDWQSFHLIPSSIEAMAELARLGFEFVVITNQAGIGRGVCTTEQIDLLHQRMVSELAVLNIPVLRVIMCPHHWLEQCRCRKPAPGMFYLLEKELLLHLPDYVYIGDDSRDMQAAANAGCQGLFLGESTDLAEMPALGCFADLRDAIPKLVAHYQRVGAI
jgi:D-glycero-D-manno-heptose 1,7-bisphosphate phosphatase